MDLNKIDTTLRILFVEDNKHDRVAFRRTFKDNRIPCDITEFERAEDAFERYQSDETSFDIVVVDYSLPGMSGLDFCKKLIERKTSLPLVLLAGTGSEKVAVEALKAGVYDYIIKDDYAGYLELLPFAIVEVVKKHNEKKLRIKAENALRNSEARIRAILQTAPNAIFTLDERGIIKTINPEGENIFGYSMEYMIGKNINILLPGSFHSEHSDYLRNFLDTGVAKVIGKRREFIARRNDGSTFPVEINVAEMRIGKERMFTGILRDITERKRAEEMIRKTASIVESSDDAIIGKTLEGIVTSWNSGAERIYGYSAAEMIGKHISILLPIGCSDEVIRILEKISHGERIEHFETIRRTKDGREINISINVFPIEDPDGKITEVATIERDITKTKELEKELIISHKMSSLGRLTAGVFHELLNPINIISSHVQLMLSEGKWGSKTEEDLKSIQEEISRIVKITDGLLRFSRKGEFKTEEVEINSLLEKLISIVEPEMKLDNIKFIKKFEDKLLTITANNDELRQIFLNLITNMRDALPESGELTIITQSIIKQGKPFVRIKFIDTGCGIAKENLDKVFDPFFTTKKEGEGIGLGLSITYGIIEDHGGTMSVESEEGKGTTFTIDLPVKN